MSAHASHWDALAAVWSHMRPPLRPSENDVAAVVRFVRQWTERSGRRPRALILGVTPELHKGLAPLCEQVSGVDRSEAMIRRVWPGARDAVTQGDWRHMPHATGVFDVVCCDGGLHLLDPDGQAQAAREIGRVLAPGGLFLARLFAPPDRRESVAHVIRDADAGLIDSVHALKVRLIMALHPSRRVGVRLHDVWCAAQPARRAPSGPLSRWSRDEWATLDAYENAERRYHLLTVGESVELMSIPALVPVGRSTPSYVLGQLFPTVFFERRST